MQRQFALAFISLSSGQPFDRGYIQKENGGRKTSPAKFGGKAEIMSSSAADTEAPDLVCHLDNVQGLVDAFTAVRWKRHQVIPIFIHLSCISPFLFVFPITSQILSLVVWIDVYICLFGC